MWVERKLRWKFERKKWGLNFQRSTIFLSLFAMTKLNDCFGHKCKKCVPVDIEVLQQHDALFQRSLNILHQWPKNEVGHMDSIWVNIRRKFIEIQTNEQAKNKKCCNSYLV